MPSQPVKQYCPFLIKDNINKKSTCLNSRSAMKGEKNNFNILEVKMALTNTQKYIFREIQASQAKHQSTFIYHTVVYIPLTILFETRTYFWL